MPHIQCDFQFIIRQSTKIPYIKLSNRNDMNNSYLHQWNELNCITYGKT